MSSILDWLRDPTHVVICIYIYTAVCSIVVRALDKTSRGHAFFSFCASVGVDVPRTLEALGRLIFGNGKPPSPGGGAVAALVFAVALSVSGCALFSPAAGGKFPADVEQVAACVTQQIESGNTKVENIVLACEPAEASLVLDVVQALINSHQFNADHPKQMPWVRASMKSLAAKYR